ncbi:hypothetical protein [Niallia endozanthoxylica]|uniref:DUF2802 domain-containing protein n=1 Tax=Niallia endozanthoxylica TaxID=2036016 RepID=A0A5J5HUQ8_9BACI|nr:hypothetical protein [Niallia endozanthoxylica]KAA9026299.1 hypothetical protein F4V44_10550 [Niallia endozanthoxylica]
MNTLFISLFGISILLMILSFFLKDPYKQLREEIDELNMQQLQEMYQIKKKLKVLEEELLVNDIELSPPLSKIDSNHTTVHEIIKNQVRSLAGQGTPIEQIARQSSLPVKEVQAILMESRFRGEKYE